MGPSWSRDPLGFQQVAAAAAAVAASALAAARQRCGAFVVAFMVVAGTAISSDLLKKIKVILT